MSVIIGAGDSILYGFWDKEGGWFERLRKFLDERALQSSPDTLNTTDYVASFNLGIPGDTSLSLLKRFEGEIIPRINHEQETIILIAIGINDSCQISIDVYAQNLAKLLKLSKKYSQKNVFVGPTPVDEARTAPIYWNKTISYKNEYIKRYNDCLRKFAQKEKTHFIEIFEKLIKEDVASLMEDGIHPNSIGHEAIFTLVKKYLLDKDII